MALEKWNMNFCLEHSIGKYRTIFFMFRRSSKFSAGMVQKVMFYLLSNSISPKLFAKHFLFFILSNTESESSNM